MLLTSSSRLLTVDPCHGTLGAAATSTPVSSSRIVLSLRKVSARRLDKSQEFVLEVPSLQVREGEFILALGPSGCGKSTLLDLLGLVLRHHAAEEFRFSPDPEADSLDLLDKDESELAPLRGRHIGYVLQHGGLLPFLSCAANVLLPCQLNRVREGDERLLRLAARLGIVDHLRKKPDAISGGQQQRVSIARALIHQPALVLADEPTAAVDRVQGNEIFELFRAVARERRIAVVVASHDVELASRFAERFLEFQVSDCGPGLVRAECRERNP